MTDNRHDPFLPHTPQDRDDIDVHLASLQPHIIPLVQTKSELLRIHAFMHLREDQAESEAHQTCLDDIEKVQGWIDRGFRSLYN